MSYFISPPEATDWSYPLDAFITALGQEWPHARIEPITNPADHRAIAWRIIINGTIVDGSFDREGQVISLDADFSAAALVAVWWRKHIILSQPLVFYDDGYHASVLLTATTTVDDITHAFGDFLVG